MGAKQSKTSSSQLTAIRRRYQMSDCLQTIRQCIIDSYNALFIYETLISFLPEWEDREHTNLYTYREIYTSQMSTPDSDSIKCRVGLISNCPDSCFWIYHLLQQMKDQHKANAWRNDVQRSLMYDGALFELEVLHCEYHPCPEYHKNKQSAFIHDLEQVVIADIGLLIVNIYNEDSLDHLKAYWNKMCEFYQLEQAAKKAKKKQKKKEALLSPTSFVLVSTFYTERMYSWDYGSEDVYSTSNVYLEQQKIKIRSEQIEAFCNETGISYFEVFAGQNDKNAHKELFELMCRTRYWHRTVSKTKENALGMFFKTREPSCVVGSLAAYAPYPPW